MKEINLLDTLPQVNRSILERKNATLEDKLCHWKLDREYFDGNRQQGLGGYYYDGRWRSVAKRMKEFYSLKNDSTILDVGCAKGFMLYEFTQELINSNVFGIDISDYALRNAKPEVAENLFMANAKELPFDDNSFDLVLSINSLHNILSREEVIKAIKEIERVSKKNKFISVSAFSNQDEKDRIDNWAVVATTYLHCDDWIELFKEAGYTGEYYWFKP